MYYLGRLIGLVLFIFLIVPMRIVYGRKKCRYIGTEKLSGLQGRSFFVAANHIKPRSRFLKFISMPYDAYIARRMFLEFGFYSTALTSYDSPANPKSALGKFFTEKVKEQLTKGIVVSSDLIPLNRKKQDKITLADMRRMMNRRPSAIGIFPEGTWFRGFRKTRKLHPGVAVLSKRYEMPVVPVYIDAYNINGDISITVGDIVYDTKKGFTMLESIRETFLKSRESLKASVQKTQENAPVFSQILGKTGQILNEISAGTKSGIQAKAG